jgi:hypothetical protein
MWSIKIQDPFKCDIPEELWGNWPIEGETDIAYGCKERNFWNCAAWILESVIEPDEATIVVLWRGDL